MGVLFEDAKGAVREMSAFQWIWILSCAVNVVAISVVWWKLYDEQPNDWVHQIIVALMVASGPIGTYFLFVVCSLGYGLVIFCGAMQGLGYGYEKPPSKK